MKDRQDFYNYKSNNAVGYHPAPPHKKTSFWSIFIGIIAVCLVAGISGFIGASLAGQDDNKIVVYVSTEENSNTTTDSDGNLTIAGVYQQNANSVVEVHTQSYATQISVGSTGAGSGVVWSDGYVITNYHVVSDASQIYITFADGETTVSATLHSKDEESDIAILEVAATNMQPVTLADSDSLYVGQTVVCIGNPLGTLGGTVTDGIISALNRDVIVDNICMELLQTNAAVSPGNSGGGLFDMNGNLIGIINAKASDDDAEGIGFAIPINEVKAITEELFEQQIVSGRVDVDTVIIDEVKVTSPLYPMVGLVVTNTITSEASKTFTVGDYILGIGSQDITTIDEWEFALRSMEVGDQIIVKMMSRAGIEYEVYYTLEETK